MGLIAKITSFFLMLTMVAASGLLATSVTLHDSIDIIAGSSTNSIASSGLTSVAAATGNSIIEPPRVWTSTLLTTNTQTVFITFTGNKDQTGSATAVSPHLPTLTVTLSTSKAAPSSLTTTEAGEDDATTTSTGTMTKTATITLSPVPAVPHTSSFNPLLITQSVTSSAHIVVNNSTTMSDATSSHHSPSSLSSAPFSPAAMSSNSTGSMVTLTSSFVMVETITHLRPTATGTGNWTAASSTMHVIPSSGASSGPQVPLLGLARALARLLGGTRRFQT